MIGYPYALVSTGLTVVDSDELFHVERTVFTEVSCRSTSAMSFAVNAMPVVHPYPPDQVLLLGG